MTSLPPILFGTSALGHLYREISWDTKLRLMESWLESGVGPLVLDTAGKYGAGLALETLGRAIRELGIRPERLILSNKLGWYRIPLRGDEPLFEPGIWKNLSHDAEQRMGARGIRQCFEQGCELLNGFVPTMVSVHDPDEYLAASKDAIDRGRRKEEIQDSYAELFRMKRSGLVSSVGIGSKDWRVVRELADGISFDWVMLANSLTVYSHPVELLDFIVRLAKRGVPVINSAVFHGGFLLGGDHFDYQRVIAAERPELFAFRERFHALCRRAGVEPLHACVRFGMSIPGVIATALNTSDPERVDSLVRAVQVEIPPTFWDELREIGLFQAGREPALS